jgi:hypothetical protein
MSGQMPLTEEKPMNFFEWIRVAVRRAVLLGVSDAVEDLGSPADVEDSRQKLLAVLRGSDAGSQARLTGNTKRKKLGRSLSDAAAQANPST